MSSLKKRSARAALWNSAGNAVRLLLQFGVGILLARMLGPHAFGLVAIALILIGFGQLVTDLGFNSAIIQARELHAADVDFLFTIQFLVGAVLTALVVAIAEPAAAFFAEPNAGSVIRWMAPVFLMRAMGQTSAALLSRNLDFHAIQIGTVGGYVSGYLLVGVSLAFTGHGVWSLVAAYLTQTAVSSALAMAQANRIPRLTVRGGRRDLFRFGRQVISANLANWAIINIPAMIVGRIANPTTLGLYSRAVMLAGAPRDAVVTGLQGVLFAATSRSQDNPEEIKKALLACVTLYILLAGSILLAVAATAVTVVVALFGAEWAEAARLLTPLAVAMMINGAAAFLGPTLMGIGRVKNEAIVQWQTLLTMQPLVIVAAQISVAAIAWSIAAAQFLRLILLVRALHGIIKFDWSKVTAALLPPWFVAVSAAISATLADQFFSDVSEWWRLPVIVASSCLGGCVVLSILRHSLLNGPLAETIIRSNILPSRMLDYLAKKVRSDIC